METLTGGQLGNSLRDCQVPNVRAGTWLECAEAPPKVVKSAGGVERKWDVVTRGTFANGSVDRLNERWCGSRRHGGPRPETSNLPAAVRAETKVDLPEAFRPIKMDNSPGESFMF
ncbi:MAG: hypothetical protein ACTS45_01970, partial [Candidatus Hodgkinia cicadicola]